MATNEKELRAARQAERKEKKVAAAAEQEKKDRRYRRNVVIVVVVLVVLVIGALLINSNYFYTKTTAMTVGNTKYSPAEVSYFYRSTYNTVYQNLYNQLGSMISYVLDTSTPLSEQAYPYSDEDITWADAIKETADEDIVRVTAFSEAAVKAGRTLSAEDQATIEDTMNNYRAYATASGFANVDKFYAAYFGKGVDEETVARLQEKILLGSNYYNEVLESFVYSSDELAAYYNEHADELDYYAYYAYPVSSSLDVFSDLEDAALQERVHAAAQEIVDAATDEASFIEAVKALAGADTVPTITHTHAESVGSTYKDWVLDPARQPGDATVVDYDNISYALFFVEHDKNDYNTADFRHILVMAVADEEGNYTEEALALAREKAEMLLNMWAGDPTEENFAEMANLNSEDSGSNDNGGLYEQVTKYTMVPGVNDFLFNAGHSAGDTDIVFGQSSSYTGYHVMYYVGDNLRSDDILSEDALRTADFNAKAEEISAGYEIKPGSGMRFVSAL